MMIFSAKVKKQAAADACVNILQQALADPNFVSDYQRLHPVEEEIDILTQSVPKMLVENGKLFTFIL